MSKLKFLVVFLLTTLLCKAQNKKGAFSLELNNYFVSESKGFDLKSDNMANLKSKDNPVALLKSSLAPAITYDYFLADKKRFALSIGISQAIYLNTLNDAKLDELAKSHSEKREYTLNWQGNSPKMNYGTMLATKLWFPVGNQGIICIEPRGGVKYGGTKGLKINALFNQEPTTVYAYESKSTVPVYEMKVGYITGIGNKVRMGLNTGYGNTGFQAGWYIWISFWNKPHFEFEPYKDTKK